MLDQIRVTLHVDLPGVLESAAQACMAKDTDGRLAYAAAECRQLSGELKGALIHPEINAADIICKAADALRAKGRGDLVDRFDALAGLIKGDIKRRVVGQSIIGAARLIEELGKNEATILAMEHPESGEAIPIAKVK